MSIRDFNIIEYLDSRNIPYSTSGKNVSQGWIGIQCPFCGDKSNHLGINLSSKATSCFICGKHSIFDLIKELDNCSFGQAKNTIGKFGGGYVEPYQDTPNRPTKVILPGKPLLLPLHRQFLINRNFDPDHILQTYQVRSVGLVGRYKHRLIIPIFDNRRITGFTARDVTGKAAVKYISIENEKAIVSVKDSLYNLNRCTSDTVIVVEGATDVWRIGKNSCATFGIGTSKPQLFQLSKFKRIFILFDAEEEAQKRADKLAVALAPLSRVHVLYLEQGDPADMKPDDVNQLRKLVFGKVY